MFEANLIIKGLISNNTFNMATQWISSRVSFDRIIPIFGTWSWTVPAKTYSITPDERNIKTGPWEMWQ